MVRGQALLLSREIRTSALAALHGGQERIGRVVEPTYPYCRLLLRFDAKAFLLVLDFAFYDSYFIGEVNHAQMSVEYSGWFRSNSYSHDGDMDMGLVIPVLLRKTKVCDMDWVVALANTH